MKRKNPPCESLNKLEIFKFTNDKISTKPKPPTSMTYNVHHRLGILQLSGE